MIKTKLKVHKTDLTNPESFNGMVDQVLGSMKDKTTVNFSGFDVTPIKATLSNETGLALEVEGYIK